MVTTLFNKYVEGYKNTIDGKFNKLNRDTEPIGAQMRAAFERIFKETYEGRDSLTYYLTDQEIDRAFINFDGDAFPGSPSYDGFLSLLHPFIDKLYHPAYDLVEECYNNLENTSKQMISEVFKRFPALEEMVTGLTSGVLMKGRDKTKHLVKCLLDSERNYIFTSDENYNLQCGDNLPPPPHMSNDQKKKKFFIKQVRDRLDFYLSIVLRNLKDSIPKVIGQILLEKTTANLNNEMSAGLTQSREILECMSEPEHIRLERETNEKTGEILRKAMKKLEKPGLLNNEDDDDY